MRATSPAGRSRRPAPARRARFAIPARFASGFASALAGAGTTSRRAVAWGLERLSARSSWPAYLRVLVAAVALSLLLAAGYRFWLRDSAVVSVDRVSITGLTTEDADRLRAALVSTARTMTTLHVDRSRLQDATAGYPVVRRLEVTTDFPHGLRIHVVEHEPAAIAVSSGGRVPVAADGTVLRGLPVEDQLPTLRAEGGSRGDRLADATAVRAARMAGAAPAPLRRRLDSVSRDGDRGYVGTLREGPELIFGSAGRLRAKWAAAARVLADSESQGASYLDLRVPGRPAAGGAATSSAPAGAPTDAGIEAPTAVYGP